MSVARGVEHVSGLTAENFEVFDNGVKQKITSVAVAQVPLEVYLVLDLSGSVQGEALAQLKRAANALVDGLVPADWVALLTFSKTVAVRQELTSNFQAFKAALAEATPSGNTALYDAVLKAISMREPKDNRAIVVVFTDEGDNASTATTKQVVDAAERSDVTGYGVLAPQARSTGVGMGGAGFGAPQFQIGFLRSLADATGGRVFRASPRLPLEDLFELVLDDARTRERPDVLAGQDDARLAQAERQARRREGRRCGPPRLLRRQVVHGPIPAAFSAAFSAGSSTVLSALHLAMTPAAAVCAAVTAASVALVGATSAACIEFI